VSAHNHDEYIVSTNTKNDEDAERTQSVEGPKSERTKIYVQKIALQ
jgi:hypothetical protein